MTFAPMWAFFLPSAKYSQYFHVKEEQVIVTAGAAVDDLKPKAFLKKRFIIRTFLVTPRKKTTDIKRKFFLICCNLSLAP